MGKMTEDKAARVVELYQKYGTGAKVAQELNVTLYMVYKHLRANDIEPKKNGDWQDKKAPTQILISLYQSGRSVAQIAQQFSMAPCSVWERLNTSGVKLRSRVEGMVASGYKKRGSDKAIIQMYQSGTNAKDIARHYGLKDSGTILEVLHKHNIKIQIHSERSPHWKGGKLELNKMVRNCATYVNWRSEVFADRNYTCEVTGQRGGKLNVHHKKSFAELLDQFILAYPNMFESQEARLKAVEAFQPFWDKTNVLVVTEETHRQIHTNLISV